MTRLFHSVCLALALSGAGMPSSAGSMSDGMRYCGHEVIRACHRYSDRPDLCTYAGVAACEAHFAETGAAPVAAVTIGRGRDGHPTVRLTALERPPEANARATDTHETARLLP